MKKLFLPLLVLLVGCQSSIKLPKASYEARPAKIIYVTAERYLADGMYNEAIEELETLEATYPVSEYTEQAQLDMIYAYYRKGETLSAVVAADRYIKMHPSAPRVDYAYYMRGLAHFQQNRGLLARFLPLDPAKRDPKFAKLAFEDFHRLVTKYPKSRYTPDSRQRMVFLSEVLARYEMGIAKHYMDRHAYVAAINRASFVVKQYQTAPQVVEALKLLVSAYHEVGMNRRARRAYHVLALNYPKSAQLKALRANTKLVGELNI